MTPDLLVLAAGAGTRFGGLKQLVPIGPSGEALLEYSVYDAVRAGFGRVFLVVRPETEAAVRERFAAGMARRVDLAYVRQRLDGVSGERAGPVGRAKPWGTGHAVLAAAGKIDRPFAVVNADDFYGARSFAALAEFLVAGREEPVLAAVGFRVGDTLTDSGPVSRALLEVDERGYLRRAVELLEVWRENGGVRYRDGGGEERRLDADAPVSMNMWGFTPELFPLLRRRFAEFLERRGAASEAEFRLPEVIQSLVGEGRIRVKVLPSVGEWCGLTFRQDRGRVRSILASLIARSRYPEALWEEHRP